MKKLLITAAAIIVSAGAAQAQTGGLVTVAPNINIAIVNQISINTATNASPAISVAIALHGNAISHANTINIMNQNGWNLAGIP
jgi:hypothetical protein